MPSDFFATPQWAHTALGSPIALHASRRLEQLRNERPILLMGGIHGDEPEGVRLAQDTLTWLLSGGSPVCPWIVIPCLNVDGFNKRTRVNGRGVDLNRNYPSRDWSPSYTKERYHPGSGPASEPEIQAVVSIIRSHRPRLLIHCHSWQPCIVGTGSLAQVDAQRLALSSGYNAVDEIGYPTPGSLSRFGWHDLGIPVVCIEEQEQLSDLGQIWPRFARGMKDVFEDLSLRGATP